MKDKQEIQQEINKLKSLKPRCLRASVFGDNHHDAIDAQVEVLESHVGADEEIDMDEVYRRGDEGEWRQNVADAAREALEWMEGDADQSPSEQWEESIKIWGKKR